MLNSRSLSSASQSLQNYSVDLSTSDQLSSPLSTASFLLYDTNLEVFLFIAFSIKKKKNHRFLYSPFPVALVCLYVEMASGSEVLRFVQRSCVLQGSVTRPIVLSQVPVASPSRSVLPLPLPWPFPVFGSSGSRGGGCSWDVHPPDLSLNSLCCSLRC